MSAWVIETVDDPHAVITDLLRVLRPGAAHLLVLQQTRPAPRRVAHRTAPGGGARLVRRALPHRGTDTVPRPRHVTPQHLRRRRRHGRSTRNLLHGATRAPSVGATAEPGSAGSAARNSSPNGHGGRDQLQTMSKIEPEAEEAAAYGFHLARMVAVPVGMTAGFSVGRTAPRSCRVRRGRCCGSG